MVSDCVCLGLALLLILVISGQIVSRLSLVCGCILLAVDHLLAVLASATSAPLLSLLIAIFRFALPSSRSTFSCSGSGIFRDLFLLLVLLLLRLSFYLLSIIRR